MHKFILCLHFLRKYSGANSLLRQSHLHLLAHIGGTLDQVEWRLELHSKSLVVRPSHECFNNIFLIGLVLVIETLI